MKKLIAILLSLTFVLSVSVFAATITPGNSETKSVYATYHKASDTDKVYSVDITWGDMHFNYKEASKGKWDPDSLKYTDQTAEGWYPAKAATDSSLASNEIKIVNKSNVPISCGFTFTPDINCEQITGVKSFFYLNGSKTTTSLIEIPKATAGDDTTTGEAKNELLALQFEGKPNYTPFDNIEVGTITIEITSE